MVFLWLNKLAVIDETSVWKTHTSTPETLGCSHAAHIQSSGLLSCANLIELNQPWVREGSLEGAVVPVLYLQAIVGFIKSVSSVYIPQICMPAYRLDDVWQAYYPNMLAAYEIFKIAKGLESNIWRAINSITQICLNGPCLGMKHRPEEPCGVSSWGATITVG